MLMRIEMEAKAKSIKKLNYSHAKKEKLYAINCENELKTKNINQSTDYASDVWLDKVSWEGKT